jgi:hypothetical protein
MLEVFEVIKYRGFEFLKSIDDKKIYNHKECDATVTVDEKLSIVTVKRNGVSVDITKNHREELLGALCFVNWL